MSNTTSASAPSPLQAHLFIFVAEVMWGLSAPIAKDIMLQDFNGFQLVSLRIAGSALLFWGLSLLQNQQERVSRSDLAKLMLAGLLSIGFNQTLFTVGLDMTSPVNASIMTTMMPILTMFLAFLILHEPISTLKVLGIVCGATGAILIVLHSSHSGASRADSAEGDLLIIIAQFCFALYLTLFKGVLHRYSGVTCMKWMFTASILFVVPFTAQSFRTFSWTGHTAAFWGGTAYVVVGATFIAYLLLMAAQKVLRPTVVSIYNYVQPLVACIASVLAGLGVFTWVHALAACLIVAGVTFVTRSKSRAQMLAEQKGASK